MGNLRNRQKGRGNYRHSFNQKRHLNSIANPALSNESERFPWTTLRAQQLSEDKMMGFNSLSPGSAPRVGWLANMVPALVEEPITKRPVQAVDMFFICDSGTSDFRATIISRPYMYLAVMPGCLQEAELSLRRKFSDLVADISHVNLFDLAMPNHLATEKGTPFLKLETRTVGDLYAVREIVAPIVQRNAERNSRCAAMTSDLDKHALPTITDALDTIVDMREYDVAPVNRLAIDRKVNVGYWYKVTPGGTERSNLQYHEEDDPLCTIEKDPDNNTRHANDLFSAQLERLPELVERANPVVLAYDIECTKKPLKFPDAQSGDEVMMISWMVDGKGFLGINRQVVSKDIEDFEYKPHPEFHGHFKIYNEPNEKALLQRFFAEVRLCAPRVFVTFNGDYFDWPFIETRGMLLGLNMGKEIGMRGSTDDRVSKETKGRAALHMDVFHWVNRDSYLPQGSRGLKAVTRILLGFEPEEVPPEEMMRAAKERPDEMAKYSVSDAVCTYYLYMKYVHPFIFSLCNIIPLNPDDVLRKGSGTLCEMLLMCQAREKRIVAPNKYQGSAIGKLTEDGHVLESETYIGGHVEAIRTGIYRSDLPQEFNIDIDTIDDLERTLDETLRFAITVEGKTMLNDVVNYGEVRAQIVKELHSLKKNPKRTEKPLIYHLDVSAMYPNIILTNRLQPHAVVTPAQCAACDFNGMSNCQRDMMWTWRGEFYPASRGEAEMIQRRAAHEERENERRRFEQESSTAEEQYQQSRYGAGNKRWLNDHKTRNPKAKAKFENGAIATFDDAEARKNELFRRRLKDYCKTNYRRAQQTRTVGKTATVCQRENPFYVDTVRAFRDRRYEYKALLKKQKMLKGKAKASRDEEALKASQSLVILYDSLQLAHKCILNSFYGYVMRRGARWYSMEMAGIVTNTGGLIIKRAREFIDKIGLPLELDTDGIWCVLPVSFPENFDFITKSGKRLSISYICSVFNSDVANNFTNHQYQDLVDPQTFEYERRSECSILFEVDGPYKAMVLPASLEEGKNIKKRYAVFNDDGSVAELKGFEIKRRGELQLIKKFQGEIFERFLLGTSVADCYKLVGETCNKWLDVITTKGEGMTDEQILELLVEQNNMSKPLEHYLLTNQKSCAITCAGRMKEFLGNEIVKDKGLATMYVIACKPEDDQVTARAIPVKVFEVASESLRRRLLRKWTKSGNEQFTQLRNLLDWDYYRGRLANAILKIVSIPAAMQAVDNPVPRIEYPPWLAKRWRELKDTRKQKRISSFFDKLPDGENLKVATFKSLRDAQEDTNKMVIQDIEDLPLRSWTAAKVVHRRLEAVVARKNRENRKASKMQKELGIRKEELLLRSTARDAETRRVEGKKKMLSLIREPHPNKKYDYAGWLLYAKRIWRAQRAVRLHRYATKRAYSDDEGSDNGPEERDCNTNSFGGLSLAVRYGTRRPMKRRKRGHIGSRPDYAPANFVADLHRPVPSNEAFFKRKTIPLLGHGVIWQNIAVCPVVDAPGEFSLWVMPIQKNNGIYESGQLFCVPLHVKRTLYCNSFLNEPPNIPGVSCETVRGLTLPRSKQAHYLYKLEIPEAVFQQTDKDVVSIIGDSSALDMVLGSRSPLNYEVIVNLGTLCAPKRSISRMTTKKLLSQGIRIHDIQPKGPEVAPYLEDCTVRNGGSILYQAFLYGSHAIDGSSRALYILVAPQAKLVHAIVVTRTADLAVNLKRAWRLTVAERKAQAQRRTSRIAGDKMKEDDSEEQSQLRVPQLPDDCEFRLSDFETREEAWSELQKLLSSLRGGSSLTPNAGSTGLKTILLAQWPISDTATATEASFGARIANSSLAQRFSTLEQCIPATRSYPVVRLSNNMEDGNYMPVGWENQAASVAFTRYADVSDWLQSQITLSRFAGIPVGNISSTDTHSQALDVLVGRELTNRAHVLWASTSPQPDLGGIEEDDYNLQNEIPSAPEVTIPGSYRTICIETELSNLSIATILSSYHVNQLEGTDLAFDAAANAGARDRKSLPNGIGNGHNLKEGTAVGKHLAPLDEMTSSASAFRAVKDLVAKWDNIANNETDSEIVAISRGLLNHLYRWTRSESSILYDPALARFLGWLIKKVFRQLIAELRNLGATVVFASLSRLILATPKTQTVDGLRYAGFLEKTLKEKPLFRHINFEPLIGVFSGLLFVDRFNYGALPAPEENLILTGSFGDIQSQNAGSRRVYASRDIPHVRMVWDMVRYFPVPVAVLWSQVVEEFIRRPVVQRLQAQEEEEAEAFDKTVGECQDVVNGSNQAVALMRKKRSLRPRGDGLTQESKHLISSLAGQLLEKVHEIKEKSRTLAFPQVPCALHNDDRNPALEFVRSLCYVLALDTTVIADIVELRQNLLKLLGVREFAKDAQFKDPGLSVPLHGIICTYCNAVVDLDVGRDSRLWDDDGNESADREDKYSTRKLRWSCTFCGNPYDTNQIELELTKTAQRLYTSYQVQDLNCSRCKMVKRDNMTIHCPCSGTAFQASEGHKNLSEQLYAFLSVAEFHSFELLSQTVSWISLSLSETSVIGQ